MLVCAISSVMWWRRHKRLPPETKQSGAELRAQLAEACDRIRRQIEVQNSVRFSRGGGYGGDDLAIQTLQAKLDELEQLRASIVESGSA